MTQRRFHSFAGGNQETMALTAQEVEAIRTQTRWWHEASWGYADVGG